MSRSVMLAHGNTLFQNYAALEEGVIVNRNTYKPLKPFYVKGVLYVAPARSDGGTSRNYTVKKCIVSSFDPEYDGVRRIYHKDGNPDNCALANLYYKKDTYKRIQPREWVEAIMSKEDIGVDRKTMFRWRRKDPHLAAAIHGAWYVSHAEDLELDETEQAIVEVVREQVMDHLERFESGR